MKAGEEAVSRTSGNSRLLVGAALLVVLIGIVLLKSGVMDATVPDGATATSAMDDASFSEDPDGGADSSLSSRREGRPLGKDPAAADAEAAGYLRDKFGATITNKHTQIKAIEKIIEYLMRNYPDDWQQRVRALLAQAFPDLADQLFAQYQNMEAYNEWLKANRDELAKLPRGEKRDALNDARFRFFGPDAAEIFEESLRHERIYDAMDAIAQSTDTNVNQKLKTYLDAINETYGEKAPQFVEKRQTELMNNFLTLGTVQDELRAMNPEVRAQQMDSIRSAMGMDDEALGRWRELDDQRNRAWQAADGYMEERDQITNSSQGDEQARRLAELRSRRFGEEAEIIAEEEETGFFRFGHPRVYGKE